MHATSVTILYFYGTFLILCGIVAVIFIGLKAKTALMSGGMSGAIAITTAWLLPIQTPGTPVAGLIIPLLLFIVFAWRSTKTLFRIFELIPLQHEDLKGKGIAFLIISLMAVVSLFSFVLLLINF